MQTLNQSSLARFALAGLVFVITGCVGASVTNSINTGSAPAAPLFPPVQVADLEGKELTLPTQLPSEAALVVLGFAHEQREAVGRWMNELQATVPPGENLSLLEVPVIDSANMALRSIIRNGMRTAVTDTTARERTLPLFVNREAFCRAIGVTDLATPTVLLLTRAGKIAFSISGEATPERLKAVRDAAASLKAAARS